VLLRQYTTSTSADQVRLTDILEAEWRTPNPNISEPVILEERDSLGAVIHVYVVWSDWAHLSRETRGEIIMDAAERVKPLTDVVKITIAMGLSPDEADRFNIQWR
jgi:hypothetical protein